MGPAAILSVLVNAKGVGATNAQLASVQGNLVKTSAGAGKMGAALKRGAALGAAAVLGIGVALFKLGEQFDDAYDTIRVGTGKTGKELDGLKGDFREVVKAVPASFKDASTAVADLNTRLGLTGKPLQARSKQFLELSRITKTDVSDNIKTVTRAFGDWEVKTEDQSATLDKFFRAAQSSGASVSDLAKQVVQFGAPLRQVGFTLDEATAMFAEFEKAGVNTQTMMPGLKMALKNFMQAGVDPKKGLQKAFKDIQSGAMSTTEALELFGTRAGADMVEAVKQGRFELDDMTKTLRTGSDTIMKAGRDTMDFGEKWTMLKNRVFVALEPIAMRLFDAIGRGMDMIVPATNAVIGAFNNAKTSLQGTGASAGTLAQTIETLKGVFASIADVVRGTVDTASALWARFGSDIVDYLDDAAKAILKIVGGIAKMLEGLVNFVAGVLTGDWARAWDGIKAIFSGAWKAMTGVVQAAWNTLESIVSVGMKALLSVIRGFVQPLVDVGKWVINRIADGIKTITDAFGDVGGWIKNRVVEFVKAVPGAYVDAGRWVINRIADGISTVTEALGAVGGWIKNRVVEFVKAVPEAYLDAGRWITNRIADGITTVTETLGDVGGWIKNRVVDLIRGGKGAGEKLVNAGEWILDRIVDGIRAIGGKIREVVVSLKNKIVETVKDVFSSAISIPLKISLPSIKLPGIGGEGGGNVGPGVSGSPTLQGIADASLGWGLSGGRGPGQSYRPGDDGYHGMNRARDLSGPASAMLGFARMLAASPFAGKLLELIYTPLGFGIKNGSRVGLDYWGPAVNADHFDHVHVAMANGGHVRRGGWAMVGELGPELVRLPSGSSVFPTGTGPAGGGPIQIIIEDGAVDPNKIRVIAGHEARVVVEQQGRSVGATYLAGGRA